jgi:hypothetical protein
MGANAQTTVPTFTTGQVLTAQQQNDSARTGVPVFASTVTRDAAFGGTGEKTLAEGQLAYVEGTGLQSYNGSSWVTWGTAPATSGLVVVKAETTFSASSSVTFDSVFTSTYADYEIIFRYTSSADSNLQMRFRASGSSNSTTNYNVNEFRASTSVSTNNSTGQTSFFVQYAGQTNLSGFRMTVINPEVAAQSIVLPYGKSNSGGSTTFFTTLTSGSFTATTQFDGVEFYPTSGTITGSYMVYGYAKS